MIPRALGLFLFVSSATARATPVFEDDFETDKGWTSFEELVQTSTSSICYGVGLGNAERSSLGPVRSGAWSMRVHANEDGATLSNHVIGQKRVLHVGTQGRWRYTLWFYADPAQLALTQSGPEFSLQNTHPIGLDWSSGAPVPRWRTRTAGLQFVGNQWDSTWRIWSVEEPGDEPGSEVASWQDVDTSMLPLIDQVGWYRFSLEVDYDNNQYETLEYTEPDGSVHQVDLSAWSIARELKWYEGALWVSVEAENLWTCEAPATYQHVASYDDIKLEQLSGAIPSAPVAQNLWRDAYVGEVLSVPLSELASDANQDLDPSTVTILVPPTKGTAINANGTIHYEASAPGGDGFKYRVCDASFMCTEAWVTINSPNRAPVGSTAYVSVASGQTVVLPNPITDPDGNLDPSSRTISVSPVQGSAQPEGANSFSYTAPAGFVGEVGFHVTACDAQPWGWCAGAWVVVTVQ